MPLLGLLALSALQAKQPAIDRSGEPVLAKVIAATKALDKAHIVIWQSARDAGWQPLYPGSRIDIWIEKPKFRIETTNMWEAGTLFVSDGAALLTDNNSEWSPATIVDVKGSLDTLPDGVKSQLQDLSPLFLFLNGAELDKIADKAAPIREDGGSLKFRNKKLGAMTLHYRSDLIPDLLEYDNEPALKEQHESFPEWADEPDPGALTRNEVSVTSGDFGEALFRIVAPKGRQVEDRRASHKAEGKRPPM